MKTEDKKAVLDQILLCKNKSKKLELQREELEIRQRELTLEETNLVRSLVGDMQTKKEKLDEMFLYKNMIFQIEEEKHARSSNQYSIKIKEIKTL